MITCKITKARSSCGIDAPDSDQDEPIREALDMLRRDKIVELAELIFRGGDESAGALLLLMGLLQNSKILKEL